MTGCQKCNEKQKATAEKVITHLRTKRPMDWERLVQKYDPQGQFKKRFEAGQKVWRIQSEDQIKIRPKNH